MPGELQRYVEPLSEGELSFLLRKEQKERRVYYKVFRILMIVSFVAPYIGAWYRVAEGAPNAFSYPRFFVAAGILLSISSFSTWLTYRYNLRKLQLDILHRTKTIDTIHITRKIHVLQNSTYYFYIDSATKLSIEVSSTDFERLSEGDEVSIEYTTYSREYLGYF